eukprot:scaffold79661_cov57-Phaeocystis_antarctica.AAC.2
MASRVGSPIRQVLARNGAREYLGYNQAGLPPALLLAARGVWGSRDARLTVGGQRGGRGQGQGGGQGGGGGQSVSRRRPRRPHTLVGSGHAARSGGRLAGRTA